MSKFGNLVISTVSSAGAGIANNVADYAIGYLSGKLRDALGLGRKGNMRFYFKDDQRSFWSVIVNSALKDMANAVKGAIVSQLRGLVSGKKKEELINTAMNYRTLRLVREGELQNDASKAAQYGVMDVDGHKMYCRDMYGNKMPDGLIIKVPSKKSVKYRTLGDNFVAKNGETKQVSDNNSVFSANWLVWYDATAMINVNSNRNVIFTKVAGRDYSRKELVSNGDIEFSVSGHMLSLVAELYPENKVQQFIQCMQYKGIVEVNNLVLGQFNIEKMVIKDFSISHVEGSKSRVDYTFNAVGIQPKLEVEVDSDTLFIDTYIREADTEESKWKSFLKSKMTSAANSMIDIADSLGSSAISSINI